jgi:hypothetical protein
MLAPPPSSKTADQRKREKGQRVLVPLPYSPKKLDGHGIEASQPILSCQLVDRPALAFSAADSAEKANLID